MCSHRLLRRSTVPNMSPFAAMLPGTDGVDSLEKGLMAVKMNDDVWKKIAGNLGDESLDEIKLIAMTTNAQTLLACRELPPVVVTKANLLLNLFRSLYKLPVEDIHSKGGGSLEPRSRRKIGSSSLLRRLRSSWRRKPRWGVSMSTAVAPSTDTDPTCLQVGCYFQQANRLVVKFAPKPEIKNMRERWNGGSLPPPANVKPSDELLSVLWSLLGIKHNVLSFDMAIVAPFNTRRDRNLTRDEWKQGEGGRWFPHEAKRVNNLADWKSAREFATVALVMANAVDRAVAEAYRDGFVQLRSTIPDSCFWIATGGNIVCRTEHVLDERDRLVARHEQCVTTGCANLSRYDPARPWNEVLLNCTSGLEAIQFWQREVKDKCKRWLSPDAHDQNQESD